MDHQGTDTPPRCNIQVYCLHTISNNTENAKHVLNLVDHTTQMRFKTNAELKLHRNHSIQDIKEMLTLLLIVPVLLC